MSPVSPAAVWLASLLAFPVAGAPLLLHRSFRRFGWPARAVLAGAAGTVAVSWTMNLAALAGWRWNLALLVVAGLAECAALRLLIHPGDDPPEPRADTRRLSLSPLEKAAVAVCAVSVVAAFAAALSAAATSPDLLLFWGTKAQAFAAARTIDDDFLGEPFLRFLHTSYPPLVTNVFAFATIAAGVLPWMAAVATFPLVLASLAVALPGILRRTAERSNALVATAAIVASIGLLGDVLDIAGNGDMPLLLFEILSIAILMGQDGDSSAGQLLSGVLLGGAVAAKVEGLPFAVAAAVFFLALRPRDSRTRLAGAAARLLVPAAASLAAWFAFGRQRHLFKRYETYGATFDVHLDRIGVVARLVGGALGAAGAALPWLVPLAALVAAARWRRSLYPISVAGALGLFFFFTYLHGAPDPTLWIDWSAGRIFVVVAALLVLAVTAGWRRPADTEEARAPGGATPG